MTYNSLALSLKSHYQTVTNIVMDHYGELPDLDEEIAGYVRKRFARERPKKGPDKHEQAYREAYSTMVGKRYMTYDELRLRFKSINFEQIKCNFDNSGFLIYDDEMPKLKQGYKDTCKSEKGYVMKPIIRPCKDLKGRWIA